MIKNDQLVIDLHGVEKKYRGGVFALRGIDLQVHSGEIFGLLGPNGAGKSTLVKIMMTVIRASQAQGMLLGKPVGHKPTLARIGYLPEHHRFPPYLTGYQVLDYFGALGKVPRTMRRRRSEELLEMVNLKDAAWRKVGTYSKGMQQRLGLAQALINDPELVVLDEPTDGLDPIGREMVRKLLCHLRDDEHKTIFINSHLLGEVERVCDRVAILQGGLVREHGRLDVLTAGSARYKIEFDWPDLVSADINLEIELAQCLPDNLPYQVNGRQIEIWSGDAAMMQPVIDMLRRNDLTLISMQPVRQSLEDLFFGAMGEDCKAG